MNWQSRLIRFRFPGEDGATGGGCNGVFAAECNRVKSRLADLKGMSEELILH